MYVILWQFGVAAEKLPAFLAAYRADGDWVNLSAFLDGYLGNGKQLINSSAFRNRSPTPAALSTSDKQDNPHAHPQIFRS